MSEREEVQREFASGDWHHELGTIYNIEAMADEIVRLRSRLAAVTVTEAMVDTVVRFLYRHFDIILNRDGATKMLTAALTNMKNI